MKFTHIEKGRARMVDISGKPETARRAVVRGRIMLRPETMRAIREGTVEKGNVLATARVAATLAVKDTPHVIPMCHPIPVSSVAVDFDLGEEWMDAEVEVKSTGRTGVEMEALHGAAVALLTVWDMVKSSEKDESGNYPVARITDLRVLVKEKSSKE